MTWSSVLHLVLHFVVPGAVAWFAFRQRWRRAWLILAGTMIIDADHLLADPIYDPMRCSVGFHPLHSPTAVAVYIVLSLIPRTRLIGIGLMIHIALDALDCL